MWFVLFVVDNGSSAECKHNNNNNIIGEFEIVITCAVEKPPVVTLSE